KQVFQEKDFYRAERKIPEKQGMSAGHFVCFYSLANKGVNIDTYKKEVLAGKVHMLPGMDLKKEALKPIKWRWFYTYLNSLK
ncbi:MAG: hypothetical protein WD431_06935, partial [Cyclobacteriaceae bacterium]